MTEFPIFDAAGAIGAGPDGHIWFAEYNAGKLGRMTVTAPQASLSTTAVGFGSVQSGDTADETVTLTNTGTLDLHLSSVGLSGSAFATLGSTSCSGVTVLAQNETCDVDVRLTAGAAGPVAGTLTFDSDSPDTPATVALTGTVVAAPTPSPTPTPTATPTPTPTATPDPPVTPEPPVATPTPAPAATPAPLTVSLRSVSLAASNTVVLRIRCDRTCAGTAKLKLNGASIGSAPVRGAAGAVVTVRVRPSKPVKRKRVTIALDVRDSAGVRDTVTVTRKL
jgi:hypothetical protein